MGVCPFLAIFSSEGVLSEPPFPFKDDDCHSGDDKHEDSMNPEGVRAVAEGDGGRHREHIGIHRHREEDSRKDGENLHGEVELAREEGIVGGLKRFNGFFVAFEYVPDADIGADEVLEVWLEIIGDVQMVFCEERFEYGTLWFQRPSEIEDIAFENGNLEHHLFFLFREDLGFDEIEALGDVVEFREAGIEEDIEHSVEEVRWSLTHVESATTFVLREFGEEFRERVDVVFVTGDEVSVGEDDIEFARESRPVIGIEEGYVDGKKKTPVILDDFRLIGRRDELFDGEGMNGKVFLKIRDVFVMRIFEVDPGDLMEFHLMHKRRFCFFGKGESLPVSNLQYTRIILTAEEKYRTVFRYAESFPSRFDTLLSTFRVERAWSAWLFHRWSDLPFSSEL